MDGIIEKAFKGLERSFYIREMLFVMIFAVPLFIAGLHQHNLVMLCEVILNAALYPYARFVYKSVMGYIVGNNLFVFNSLIFLGFKFLMMLLCFMLAWLIAPIGLVWLYFHHSRSERLG